MCALVDVWMWGEDVDSISRYDISGQNVVFPNYFCLRISEDWRKIAALSYPTACEKFTYSRQRSRGKPIFFMSPLLVSSSVYLYV